MIAYMQGEIFNASKLATNLGVSVLTISRYLSILSDLFLIRILRPWSHNISKRLVKSPKVYMRDSGLAHALLGIDRLDSLLEHPVVGGSWENYVIENILSSLNEHITLLFYRTAAGAEIDLVLEINPTTCIAIEIKRSLSPTLSRGFYQACEDLKPVQSYVVYAGKERFRIAPGVDAVPLITLMNILKETYSQR